MVTTGLLNHQQYQLAFDGLEVLRLVPRSAIPKLQHAAGNSSETHRGHVDGDPVAGVKKTETQWLFSKRKFRGDAITSVRLYSQSFLICPEERELLFLFHDVVGVIVVSSTYHMCDRRGRPSESL